MADHLFESWHFLDNIQAPAQMETVPSLGITYASAVLPLYVRCFALCPIGTSQAAISSHEFFQKLFGFCTLYPC